MIKLDGDHVVMTWAEYRALLAGEKRHALVALEAADTHLRGHVSNGSEFDDMRERVVGVAREYIKAQQLMPEWVEMAESHSDAVRMLAEDSKKWREVQLVAESHGCECVVCAAVRARS